MIDHTGWINSIEVSGPFLSEKVLAEAFPNGLAAVESEKRKSLRQAYGEWREAMDGEADDREAIHKAWVYFVLGSVLDYVRRDGTDILFANSELGTPLKRDMPEHGVTLSPDRVLLSNDGADKKLLLINSYARDVKLHATSTLDGWAASPIERMILLCRASGVRLGLVTNGEAWTLVHAPVGSNTSTITWYANIWLQEPTTLQAFIDFLGVGRMYGPEKAQLPALLEESAKHQDEVTEELGGQVTRAIEVLVQALDRADLNKNRELLTGITSTTLYEASLTVMMRIVFMLSAEERGLLLMGDDFYETHYAISTLLLQLRPQSEEVLHKRYDAWSRLLSTFRAVYDGIEHESLRLPALGGSLFDPDRYPFLEGRKSGSDWRTDLADPLPIDNRTVMLLLESVQVFKGRLLSYKGLDVEQIGYVYEGLLERTITRAKDVTLAMDATQSVENPWLTLSDLNEVANDRVPLEKLLKERTGRAVTAIRKSVDKAIDDQAAIKLLSACQGDNELFENIKVCHDLIRQDPWGYPLVYPKNAFMVVKGSDRRDTGTHYTPKVYTEAMVETTLEPLVYEGPCEGTPKSEWKLRSAATILELKICDPAMGSGAFLVQVCRYLSGRLVEAWKIAEANGQRVTMKGTVVDAIGSDDPLPENVDDRLELAKRLIAERCLYGVDMNPLAVELAKLSIWLVTLSKGRPFGFLDHSLRSGDSLLGVANLENIRYLSMDVGLGSSKQLFAEKIDEAVDKAIELRLELRARPVIDIQDINYLTEVDQRAKLELQTPTIAANALIAKFLEVGGNAVDTTAIAIDVGAMLNGDNAKTDKLIQDANIGLKAGLSSDRGPRKPFHWVLEFPEVFKLRGGFDAIVGNPPFLGGTRITGRMGTVYRNYLLEHLAGGVRGSADLVAYFFLRAFMLVRPEGNVGFIAVNTIAEGDTRQVGLERLTGRLGATIYCAHPNEPWPGQAAVVTSRVHIHRGAWTGPKVLSKTTVDYISPFLSDQKEQSPYKLHANSNLSFEGSHTIGMGFVVTNAEAEELLRADTRNQDVIFPYLNGEDLNGRPDQSPSRWIINFWDWPEERARSYSLPYKIIEERVKPERQRRDDDGNYVLRKPLPEKWWIYNDKRPALYHKIGRGHFFERHPDGWSSSNRKMSRVLVKARTSKYCFFCFSKTEIVFSNAICVLALEDDEWFSLLQSSIHDVWVRKNASYLKTDLRYTHSDVFETFPIPAGLGQVGGLKSLGKKYHALRATLTRAKQVGLTALYNLFHDLENSERGIEELRNLHREIDHAVVSLYGWNDLNLGHGFHELPHLPEGDRLRYTMSEPARIEVLRRLSALNRQRYEEEQQSQAAAAVGSRRTKNKKSKRKVSPEEGPSLFDAEPRSEQSKTTSKYKAS